MVLIRAEKCGEVFFYKADNERAAQALIHALETAGWIVSR